MIGISVRADNGTYSPTASAAFPWLQKAIANERATADPDRRRRALEKPGPEGWNQIGTLRQQFALAMRPRPTKQQRKAERVADIIRENPDVFLPALLELLAASIGELVGELLAERSAAA